MQLSQPNGRSTSTGRISFHQTKATEKRGMTTQVNGLKKASKQLTGQVLSGIKAKAGAVPGERRPSLGQLVRDGNAEQLAKRLERASSDEINKADKDGQLPLHHAVEKNQEELVRLLVSHESNGSALDNKKRSALHRAVELEDLRLVDLVLNITSVDLPGANDRTPLHLAAQECLPAIAKLLISRGANPLKRDREMKTPLGIAAAKGVLPLLVTFFQTSSLHDTGELMRSTSGLNNSSLLHLAVGSGSAESVVYLLQLGIDKRVNDSEGCTALHTACRMGHLPLIRLLVYSDRWLLNAASDVGVTPLHEAAKRDQVPAIDFLLKEGATLPVLTSTGAPPIFYAAGSGACRNISEFLSLGVDYLVKDKDGVNLLHCAVKHTKALKVITEELKDRPDFKRLVSAPDSNGDTPLHYAAKLGKTSDVTILVDCGADIHAVNRNGANPLHIAAGRGNLRIATWLTSFAPGLLNAVDECGRTPLHIASFYRHFRVLESFLLHGGALTKDRDGRTPFHHAAWNGSKGCLKSLLSSTKTNRVNTLNVNTPDHEKATALHLAVVRNHSDAVALLLDNGASIADKNDAGQNCLDIAIAKEFKECASVILNHNKWEEAMQPLTDNPKAISQLQLLVQKMPEQAMILMDNCIKSPEENAQEQTYDFKYMLGTTGKESQIRESSGQLFEAMLRLNRKSCFSHPLCVEFINAVWKKYLGAIVLLNVSLYSIYLTLLTTLTILFPAYHPDSLRHEDSIKRLLHNLQHAAGSDRQQLNGNEKFDFCYGNSGLRIGLIVAIVICLLKETVPIWFKGFAYFKRLSNICELAVYAMTLFFLDPFDLFLDRVDIPAESCPKITWEVAALTVIVAWMVLLMSFQRLPYVGIYIVMIASMVKTMIQVVIVASLFVLGFGLAFHMLMSNQDEFTTSPLSLMRVVTMSLGDLAHDDILPVKAMSENRNLSIFYDQLCNNFSEFHFVTNDLTKLTGYNCTTDRLVREMDMTADNDCGTNSVHLSFPAFSYVFYIMFALMVPIVVLNILIGLAVGDIETVRKDASIGQIRMQAKLLVEVEGVLPGWFLNRVHVIQSSCSIKEESGLLSLLRRATRAAEVPAPEEKSATAIYLAEVRRSINDTQEWLREIERGLENQSMVLHRIAAVLITVQRNKDQVAINDSPTTAKKPSIVSLSKDGDDVGQSSDGSKTGDVPEEEQLPRKKSESDESKLEVFPEEKQVPSEVSDAKDDDMV